MPGETKDWKPVDMPGEWIGDGLMVGVEARPSGYMRTLRWAATVRRREGQGCSLEEAHAVARLLRAAKEMAEALQEVLESEREGSRDARLGALASCKKSFAPTAADLPRSRTIWDVGRLARLRRRVAPCAPRSRPVSLGPLVRPVPRLWADHLLSRFGGGDLLPATTCAAPPLSPGDGRLHWPLTSHMI